MLSNLYQELKYFSRPLDIIRGYKRAYLRPDFLAGSTVAVILIPQAIAYALIAELPPQTGLYAVIVASIVAGLWGSSIQLNTGPANAISLMVLSALIVVAPPHSAEFILLASILAVIVGLYSLILGLVRLGVLVNFVSYSVIAGFTAGAGILIAANQLRHMLGLNVTSSPELIDTLEEIGVNMPQAHLPSLIFGFGTIAMILILRKISPRIPGALVSMVTAGLLMALLGLGNQGIRAIGELPRGLPTLNNIFEIPIGWVAQLATKALAITAIGLVETIAIARSISNQTHQRLDSNQEFVGQGLANIASGFFSGYPVGGSFIRSAVNLQSNARTSISSVFAGLIVLIAVLSLGNFAGFIPLPALAGVLILTAISLINRTEILRIWHGPRGDRLIMFATFLATLLIPIEFAVLVGILLSLGYYLLQTSTPRIRPVLPDENFDYLLPNTGKQGCPQLGIVEILGDLYFGAVHSVEEYLLQYQKRNPQQRYLLLRMNNVDIADISGIHALENIVNAYRSQHGDVFISRYRQPIFEVMRSSGFVQFLGEDHFLARDSNALGYLFYKVLDPVVCIYECPYRAFKECQNLPKRSDIG
jgi:SulP family sulfate permease